MLTEFGKVCRKLRIEHGDTIATWANFLEVSSSFISAVELGNRTIPTDWIGKIAERYNLSLSAQQELESAAGSSSKKAEINLESANNNARNFAISLARKFDSLSNEQIQELQKILKK